MRFLFVLLSAITISQLHAQSSPRWRVEVNSSMNMLIDVDFPFVVEAERDFDWRGGDSHITWQGGAAVEFNKDNWWFGAGLQVGYREMSVRIVRGFDVYSPGGSHYVWPVVYNINGHYTTIGVPLSLYSSIWSHKHFGLGNYVSLSVNRIAGYWFKQNATYQIIEEDYHFHWCELSVGPQLSWETKHMAFRMRPQAALVFAQTKDAYAPFAFLCTVAVSLPVGKAPDNAQ